MDELINHVAEAYAVTFTSSPGVLLDEIEKKTYADHPDAHMLSGKVQGKFLELISCLLQPKRILEIGTFTGYSALCLAKGLQHDGELHTIELKEDIAAIAKKYFESSSFNKKIVLHTGYAKEIIHTLSEMWDIVFIDADKTGYIEYYELILPSVKQNGLIIADNVLFHGKVLQENIVDKNAKAIHAFNEHVKKDKRVEEAVLTVRDGLLLIRKL